MYSVLLTLQIMSILFHCSIIQSAYLNFDYSLNFVIHDFRK